MSVILGINAFHAGAAAAVVVDGRPVAAIAEERLNRRKYYALFPAQAILQCLKIAGCEFSDIDCVAIGRDHTKNRAAKASYVLSHPAALKNLIKVAVNSRKRSMLGIKELISRECGVERSKLRFTSYNVEHHLAHIASSYFISSWESAAGLSIDGSGDFVTCMFARCSGPKVEVIDRVFMPHSLGIFYTAVSQLIGYSSYGDEGKVMGLSALGTDAKVDELRKTFLLTKNGLKLNPRYFRAFGEQQDSLCINDRGEMTVQPHYTQALTALLGEPRQKGSELGQREMDLAYAVQKLFEESYLHLVRALHRKEPTPRLAVSGGCALNSVANGLIFSETRFTETCIHPAAGDDGLAIGAALYVSNSVLEEGNRFVLPDAYLGPEFTEREIEEELAKNSLKAVRLERDELLERTADEICRGDVVGWFQGRMEWGPRALGNRSVLAHPGLPQMKDVLNARIKRREWFRPFAPAVLVERQSEIFEHDHPSPYMLHVYKIRPNWRDRLKAVNHVDNTGRLQTVKREENPLYYDLIKTFERKTGIPVILNTSFNENEPIVCTPAEAIACFLRTKMDVLVIGPFFVAKTAQSDA